MIRRKMKLHAGKSVDAPGFVARINQSCGLIFYSSSILGALLLRAGTGCQHECHPAISSKTMLGGNLAPGNTPCMRLECKSTITDRLRES